jgi:fucose 4-O-acetylase-like acetyltransferase
VTTKRVALWDNARFLAIILVVIGHGLTKMVGANPEAYVLYVSIYLFHIPLFVFLSGYFQRADAPTPERIRGVLVDLVIPYLLLELIWSTIHSIQAGEILFNPLRPSWTLWFLLSLAAWRIALPYLVALPAPLTISILIALGSGYWGVDQTLSLSRTLAFLPFFVLGWRVRQTSVPQRWMELSVRQVVAIRVIAASVLAGVVVAVAATEPWLRAIGLRSWLTADKAYLEVGLDQWWAGGVRAGLFVVAGVMVVSFLALVPRRSLWFTVLGSGTMTVYLLHSFVLAPLRETGVLAGEVSGWVIALVILGSIALSAVLAHPWTTRVFAPLIRPTWALLSPKIR